MDTTTHPYLLEPDEDRTMSDIATLLTGTAAEAGLDPRTALKRITRPRSGYRITEALADALGNVDGDDAGDHDEDGFPLNGGPFAKDKPENWSEMSDEDKSAFVYAEPESETPTVGEPPLTGEPGHATAPLGPKVPLDPNQDPAEVAQPGDGTEDEAPKDDQPVDYAAMDYQDQKRLVAERKIEVADQKSETLVAALLADDEAKAFGDLD